MNTDFIIVANGPFLSKEIIEEAAQSKTMIALDGAANKLHQIGIVPDIILGDFDSLTEEQKKYWGIHSIAAQQQPYAGKNNLLVVPAPNQNYTDLEKAIHYCNQQQARSITIVCATGGRLDLHENTMHALASFYNPNQLMLLHTEQQTLRYARDEKVILIGQPGDKCGISAKHTGLVTSQGLAYELNDTEVSFANMLKGNSATLSVKGSAILIMPPLLASQRN